MSSQFDIACVAMYGDIEQMHRIFSDDPTCGKDNIWICPFASEGGNLECLKYAIEIGGVLNEATIEMSSNDVCTIYAVQQGCPYGDEMKRKVKDAYRRKHVEIMRQMTIGM